MRNERAWPQQCWKSCANGSNIVALRFGDHGTKEMLGVVGWKVWPVSNFAQQHATTFNNMQQGVQTDATCNIQQCWELLVNNVASVCTQPYIWSYYIAKKRFCLAKCEWTQQLPTVVLKRMQQLPTTLRPAVHCGKDNTWKTLLAMCNALAWR